MQLTDKYLIKAIGITGPSMLPTLDVKDNLILVDCFTHRFVRDIKKGEIVVCENPTKPNATLVKRVKNVAKETAEFYSEREGRTIKVYVPEGHIWVEGDNK